MISFFSQSPVLLCLWLQSLVNMILVVHIHIEMHRFLWNILCAIEISRSSVTQKLLSSLVLRFLIHVWKVFTENRSRCINSTNANHSQRQSNAITAFCSIYCQLKPAVLRRLISKLKLQFLHSKPGRPVQRALIRSPIQFAICADTNWKYCIFRLNWNCVSICENERMAQMNDHRIFKMGLVRNIKITIFTVTSIHFSTQQLNAIDMTSKQIGCDLFWARYFQCLMILLIFYRKIWTKISSWFQTRKKWIPNTNCHFALQIVAWIDNGFCVWNQLTRLVSNG